MRWNVKKEPSLVTAVLSMTCAVTDYSYSKTHRHTHRGHTFARTQHTVPIHTGTIFMHSLFDSSSCSVDLYRVFSISIMVFFGFIAHTHTRERGQRALWKKETDYFKIQWVICVVDFAYIDIFPQLNKITLPYRFIDQCCVSFDRQQKWKSK